MANKPEQDGFSDWITKEGKQRPIEELSFKGNKWPTAEQVSTMVKTGELSDTMRTPIQMIDPAYFDPLLFFIQHRDRKELNFRLRYYCEYDPLVGNLVNLHSEFPLSDFRLQCSDSTIQRHYEDLTDRIELLPLLMGILKDYWALGEAFPYGRWSDSEKTWDYFTLIPPEKIELRSTYITPNPLIILQVDPQVKHLVNSSDEMDQRITQMIDPEVVERLRTQNYMPLPSWQVSHFANKTSMTDLRGTSILKRALKDLLMIDKLRLLYSTFIDRHMYPMKIFKLGNPATGWIPSRAHFEMLRNLLASAANDPDFNIIFHHGLQVEYVGTKDKIENLIPHFEFCQRNVLTALFANNALVHGEGATYSNSNVSVRVLMHRYLTIRNRLELMVNNKIFKTMALARDYWVPDKTGNSGKETANINGKYKVLDLPKMRWNKLNLIDDTAQKNFIMRLFEKNVIPHKLIAEIFDLEEKDLRTQLQEEQGTVVDPQYIKARDIVAKDENVAKQILKGKKTNEWVFEEDKKDIKKGKEPSSKRPQRENAPKDIQPQPEVEDITEGPETPTAPAAPTTPPPATPTV